MFQILIVVIVVLLAWVIFKPDWMPKPPENQVTQVVNVQAEQLKNRSGSWLQRVKGWWPKKSSLGLQLKAFMLQPDLAKTASLSKPLQEELAECQIWVGKLSDRDAEKIAVELNSFCHSHGINLRWLLEDGGSADMRTALSGLALYYVLAVHERFNSRPVAALRTWEEAPMAKGNRVFGNRLYVQLVDAKIIEVPTRILLASEKERKAHLVNSIKAALPAHRDQVVAYAAIALNEEQTPAPEKAKAPKKAKKEVVQIEPEEQPA